MSNELDLNELAQQKYDNWDLPKKTFEEQVEWFQENTIAIIARTGASGDKVEEISLPGELYEALSEALENPRLPSDINVGDNTPEQAQGVLLDWCKDIILRSALVDQMAVPKEYHEQLPPEIQFIRIITMMRRQQALMDQWDEAMGLTQISQSVPGVTPFTFNEKRLAFLFFCTMQSIARQEMLRQQQMMQQQAQEKGYEAPNFNLPK